MNNQVLTQVQALHAMIQDNYRNESWCVLPAKKEKAVIKLQIHLQEVFPSTKAGRENRLDTLVAILPLLNPGKKPFDLDSTNRLWLAETYALLTWLSENGKAKETLRIVSLDPQGYAVQLRKLLGYIERPGGYYVPETEPAYVGDGWWPPEEGAYQRQRQEGYPAPF
jgi:hypothetical protein